MARTTRHYALFYGNVPELDLSFEQAKTAMHCLPIIGSNELLQCCEFCDPLIAEIKPTDC